MNVSSFDKTKYSMQHTLKKWIFGVDVVTINIFIQARMSSTRFPGKVLAPLHNKPILRHVVERAKRVSHVNQVVVLTSTDETDDPVASYMEHIDCFYYRGSLDNVFHRFQNALGLFPCDYFVRVSADSPFLESDLLEWMIEKSIDNDYDIISNVIVRTFPKGQSVEIVKSNVLMSVDKSLLTQLEAEHVLPYFYKNESQYKICSIKNMHDDSDLNFCVDTIQDLKTLSFLNYSYQFDRALCAI